MKDRTQTEIFEALSLPHRELPHLLGTCYRIYTDADNYTRVEAANALEALQRSGLQNVLRIQRDTIFLHNMIDLPIMNSGGGLPDIPSEIVVDGAITHAPELQDLAAGAGQSDMLQDDAVPAGDTAAGTNDDDGGHA